MAAKCLKCVGTSKRFKGNYVGRREILPKHDCFVFVLVICSHQEIVAGNTHFGVSKLYIVCQYKLVMCSAVLPFPTLLWQNSSLL